MEIKGIKYQLEVVSRNESRSIAENLAYEIANNNAVDFTLFTMGTILEAIKICFDKIMGGVIPKQVMNYLKQLPVHQRCTKNLEHIPLVLNDTQRKCMLRIIRTYNVMIKFPRYKKYGTKNLIMMLAEFVFPGARIENYREAELYTSLFESVLFLDYSNVRRKIIKESMKSNNDRNN